MIRTAVIAATATLAIATPAYAGTGASYLLSHQRPSGGIAEAGTSKASVSLTEWAAMGLRAAGRSPGRARRPGGKTMTTYFAHHAGGWRNAFALERGILAVVAIGKNPRNFADRNLVTALRNRIGGDGVIGGTQNSTYWGVIALRAAGVPAPRSSLAVIRAGQRPNGGYSWSASAGPDADDTSAAILALRAAGRVMQQRVRLAGVRLPRNGPDVLARLRAPARELGEQPVDLVGDPGPPPLQPEQPPGADVAPRPPAPVGRLQLPAGRDDDAGLGHGPGAPGGER